MKLQIHRSSSTTTTTTTTTAIEIETDAEHPTVLDVLLAASDTHPGLAYRYGCRNKLCGVCTVEVNGKPKLACRARARDGSAIAPLSTLPHVRDLVVRRDAINRQLLGKLPIIEDGDGLSEVVLDLNRCIECYACLDGCPLHAENDLDADDYPRGNPYSLLKAARVRAHPRATEAQRAQALEVAEDLGLARCASCVGCRCGVGINMMARVIRPLLAAREAP